MLEECLEENMTAFISSGACLAMEKMRHLTLRNLFKKIALELQENPTLLPQEYQEKTNILPLSHALKCMIAWDADLDMSELVCVLSTLIYNGLIKGYISQEKQVLVLAKEIDKAFPRDSVTADR